MHIPGLLVGKWIRYGRRVQKRLKYRKRRKARLVKFPWETTPRQKLEERKKRHEIRTNEGKKKLKLMRVKFPEPHRRMYLHIFYAFSTNLRVIIQL